MIKGLRECKTCHVLPTFSYNGQYFEFMCPICNCGSATDKIHGIDIAIDDWNTYHAAIVRVYKDTAVAI